MPGHGSDFDLKSLNSSSPWRVSAAPEPEKPVRSSEPVFERLMAAMFIAGGPVAHVVLFYHLFCYVTSVTATFATIIGSVVALFAYIITGIMGSIEELFPQDWPGRRKALCMAWAPTFVVILALYRSGRWVLRGY